MINNKHKSMRTDFMKTTLFSLLILAVAIGIFSTAVLNRLAQEDSRQIITKICGEEAQKLDNELELIEHSVDIIYEYAKEEIKKDEYDIFSDKYIESVRKTAVSAANMTDGAAAVYFRYNPKLVVNGKEGFFWTKKSGENEFTEEKMTDLLAYNSSDTEHVGWFYVPEKAGKPIWMKPYNNRNIDVFMISYVIPFYLDSGEFLGVIGMDIDFSFFISQLEDIKLYRTGQIAVVNLPDRLLYYYNPKQGIIEKRLSHKLYNHVTTINKKNDLLETADDSGIIYISCCKRLTNNMLLYVSVPEKEIYATRDTLIIFLIVFTVLISAVAAAAIWKKASHITEPLKKLMEVTDKYANGEWNESYSCESCDEIQKLSESIFVMAENTQNYISRLSSIARTDALTNLRNKTAYLEFIDDIKQNNQGKFNEYALTVMDLNLLKKTNDNYGHEAGDALIKEAGLYICRIFEHSAVFRIGGDEFAVVSFGSDFENIEEIKSKFENEMNYEVPDIKGIKLSIAYGTALYPKEASKFDELFKLADERMYSKKTEMKMGRGE